MAKRRKSKSTGVLVVASKVKDYVKSKGNFRVSGDFIEGLSKELEGVIDRAIDRADDNGRATLRPSDL